jgi:hypothetical protein
MAPTATDPSRYGGEFIIALGQKAAGLPGTTTVLGLMLADPGNTLGKLNQSGTQGGGPKQVITITSVKIIKAPVKD